MLRNVVVVVTTVHVPIAVVVSAALVVLGVVFMVLCTRRFQRGHQHRWIMLSLTAGLITVLAAAVIVIYLVRTLSAP